MLYSSDDVILVFGIICRQLEGTDIWNLKCSALVRRCWIYTLRKNQRYNGALNFESSSCRRSA